ncbi:MAG: GntR family transcriptional regulator [Clostridia bacterium]|jgi:GntR family transcriptional regulator|nr:GntR family transcriptional regulator [Clostridia bacterium]MDN5322048.1 GntR family transcriptional regulator [Clostridia bacterium]
MHDALPLHYRITQELRESLKNGQWKSGELFPTDKQLMEKYNVSSTTVRRAIYELVKEGWLERKPGKGTFVKGDMVETLKRLTGFFEEIREKGMKPSAAILTIEEVEVTDELLEEVPELKDFDEEKLVLIRKIQKMNDIPVVYLDSYWPFEVGQELRKHDLTCRGMYEILQDSLGITLEKADQIITASLADEVVANALNIEKGAPLLVMKRTVFSGDEALEVSVNKYRADMYSYRVQLDSSLNNENEGLVIETLNM